MRTSDQKCPHCDELLGGLYYDVHVSACAQKVKDLLNELQVCIDERNKDVNPGDQLLESVQLSIDNYKETHGKENAKYPKREQ